MNHDPLLKNDHLPRRLAIIAGKGAYPLLLAESARAQGVGHLFALGFKRETRPQLAALVDEMRWIRIGQLGVALEALSSSGCGHVVMAGQITPTHLFTMRMDGKMLALLKRLKERNAHTIFGALCEELTKAGLTLLPAYRFMEKAMPEAGVLGALQPDERMRADMALGRHVAKTVSGLEIGQTVVVKEGTILAVEAFEGTDAAIRRAGRLGGPGGVVVKVAKGGHDMRFDIPVVGMRTMRSLRRAGVACLAVEADRTILLEREKLIAEADRMGMVFMAM